MPHYRSVGEVPAKRHMQFRDERGQLYTEELMSSVGFSEESALLYHRHSPMAILSAERADAPVDALHDNAPVLPRHLKLHDCPEGGDPVKGRRHH